MGFNPHTHTGCDLMLVCSAVQCRCFNPHTHTGCDIPSLGSSKSNISFNPHTHTGCDWETLCLFMQQKTVSIHTPIQGVTFDFPYGISAVDVSIHTPIQGVTYCLFMRTSVFRFQSTHPYRVWHGVIKEDENRTKFQSTHPYRVWRKWLPAWYQDQGFNPHTHTGCDFSTNVEQPPTPVSIHTPIQGVTKVLGFRLKVEGVSIHTPIQGVTTRSIGFYVYWQFQSTHPYRVWPTAFSFEQALSKFQSTHPYRVWPVHTYISITDILVSIHTPIQGVTSWS